MYHSNKADNTCIKEMSLVFFFAIILKRGHFVSQFPVHSIIILITYYFCHEKDQLEHLAETLISKV